MIKSDLVVIGSGIAGLNFALNASSYADVLILTKESLETSNSSLAQGGIAAVFSRQDSFQNHIEDTLKVGEYLNDRKIVEYVVKNSPKEILKLEKLGANFDKEKNIFALSMESAHSFARVVHSSDTTGMRVEKILAENCRKNPRIKILEDTIAFDIFVSDKTCKGIYALNWKNNKILSLKSKAVILATGGSGQLYKFTTNPSIATADGIALAHNAGAVLQDLEFVQFHPTMFFKENFLISETVRGEGAYLKNSEGERFMLKIHPAAELAPRNVVARACFCEMNRTKKDHVYLDITHKNSDYIKKRFPNIYAVCKRNGYDMTKEQIPVQPSAHYQCGGILVNLNAETSIKGLYAIGECSCTKLHGADRMASNSLAEALVFSTGCAESVKDYMKNYNPKYSGNISKFQEKKFILSSKKNLEISQLRNSLRELMWNHVGIIRTANGLEYALSELAKLKSETEKILKDGISREIIELRNMALSAEQIAKSALARKESRGCHWIENHSE